MTPLDVLARSLERRAPWLDGLRDTDCVRLLAGAAEGAPGLTVDRYGPVLLVQTNREPLEHGAPEALARQVERALGVALVPVWNHRPAYRAEGFERWQPTPLEVHEVVGHEHGLRFRVDPRHGGLDPLLFVDLRPGRRWVRAQARGARVLNLFAYTCGLGVAAAAGGARSVTNVDFARSALTFGALNALENGVRGPAFTLVHEDVFPVLRQLAGLPIKGRGGRRDYLRLPPRAFDVVTLDPPRWAKTPFGAVDVVRDYPSLLKPAMLCLEPGGWLLATQHVPDVDRETFVSVVARTAAKIGRRLEAIEVLGPDPDVPSPEGREPALKILLARVT